ncbi:MAG: hypothetical protein M3P18_20340 [Actinomycetota bacterium]|nr:hypothetical protein [Actinomycetota bacterium]
MRYSKRVCVFALVLVLGGVVAASATADPTGAKKSAPITIQCGDTTYQGVVNGGGAWGPAHDLNSNAILIPVAFGVETGVFTDPGGTAHPFTNPARTKGSSTPNGAPLINCSYHVALSFPDGSSVVVDGTVTGFVTPA